MYQKLAKLFEFIMQWIIAIVVLMFVFLFVSWAIGYYAGALMGIKFDLSSCWSGVQAIAGAGTAGLAQNAMQHAKDYFTYKIDSQFNSQLGQPVAKQEQGVKPNENG